MSERAPAPFALEDIHLIQAHSPETIQRTWANNKHEWGKTIDTETYYARERHLASQGFASQGKLKFWILVPTTFSPEHPDLDLILSAVETYDRPGMVATKEYGVNDVLAISIASVFTPVQYRGHGYASHMMKLLWKEIEAMDIVAFTSLYSDVGPKFYGRLGWTPMRSDELVIPTSHQVTQAESIVVESVTDNDLLELIKRDAQLVRGSLQARLDESSVSSPSTVLVVVTPEPNCIQWLHARSRYVAQHILKLDQHEITTLGAKDPNSDSFVLWNHDLLKHKLVIIRWRLDSEAGDATARALIGAAQREAEKWRLSSVVVWNPEQPLADLLGLNVDSREKSIPSLGLTSPAFKADNVEWILNEKYAWC
ncbi:hypothetical protein BGZ70_005361 [Mortierella alpina]|uniref:LYC1 C-terminal domain-containing protein n=1 Tax=Mortierella alpina TaxID=64518 RepID=A0A9P6M3M7_MORAP|nr:hypothetical protein BGZ70_005361 [Mortierella alpina]